MSAGTFSSHKSCMQTSYYEDLSRGIMNIIANVPARRISSIEPKGDQRGVTSKKKTANQKMESFWTTKDSHHMLSVFASGNAFVPATFDAILAQSFYSAFTPLLCERLVCGSKYQSMYQIDVPTTFVDRYFVDLFRAFMSRSLMVIAIYRSTSPAEGSTLPFVYTSPLPDTLLRFKDRIFILCSPDTLRDNIDILSTPLQEYADGSLYMSDTLGQQMDDGKPEVRSYNQKEDAAANANKAPTSSETSSNGYMYIQSSADGLTDTSPIKEKVSRVFFKDTELPL